MPRGRTTDDPKSNVVRIRLNDDMQRWVEQRSAIEGKSISEILRDTIRRQMEFNFEK